MAMMKSLKKILIGCVVATGVIVSGSVTAMAATDHIELVSSNDEYVDDNGYISFEPFADVLQTHFRELNGVLQFRIWNATRARWETPWTNGQG